MPRADNTLDRVAEIEWQMTLNRGLADIHRAAGTTNDAALTRLLYRARRKDIITALYGIKSQERSVA